MYRLFTLQSCKYVQATLGSQNKHSDKSVDG